MPSNDGTVVQLDVLNIIRRVRGKGWRKAFDEFSNEEPVLAGYALAASDQLADRICSRGVPGPVRRLIENEMMVAQLVCIQSMRHANRKLWEDFLPDPTAEQKP